MTPRQPSRARSAGTNATAAAKGRRTPAAGGPPIRLAGGNPRIARGVGDAPVRAYIAAMPGWKRNVGRRLDGLIVRALPPSRGLRKAVRWNSPLYGVAGPDGGVGWFLGFHCFERYIKVAFFRGASLHPVPPVSSKQKEVRYLHIHEDGAIDERQFIDWVRQAARLPGERM